MRYSAGSNQTRTQMLASLGVEGTEALFESIPEADRCETPLDIAGPVPEGELLRDLASSVDSVPRVSLIGAGLYQHYIPPTVDSLAARSEWVTSYTPYQPEISQGTLLMYYEFQTWVAMLTGQQIANGGMYDGSTALAEAVLMARRLRRKASCVWVSEAVHPEYRDVLATYCTYQDIEIKTLPFDPATGRTRFEPSSSEQKDALAIVVQSPNFFGVIEDLEGLDQDAFVISVVTEAQSLAIVPPIRADIAVGEMQSLGIPVQLGGPTAGFFATKKAHVRQMPGRLVARTTDLDGKDAFCITLATREQFIRRAKATSNICTSSGLMCLRSAIYLALLGGSGIRSLARMSARASRAFADGLQKLGLERRFSGSTFNEFVIDTSSRPGLPDALREEGFLLGLPLEPWYPDMKHKYLVSLTEMHYPVVRELIQEVKSRAHSS
jgi:glycine dehydrogenase subunit 1